MSNVAKIQNRYKKYKKIKNSGKTKDATPVGASNWRALFLCIIVMLLLNLFMTLAPGLDAGGHNACLVL